MKKWKGILFDLQIFKECDSSSNKELKTNCPKPMNSSLAKKALNTFSALSAKKDDISPQQATEKSGDENPFIQAKPEEVVTADDFKASKPVVPKIKINLKNFNTPDSQKEEGSPPINVIDSDNIWAQVIDKDLNKQQLEEEKSLNSSEKKSEQHELDSNQDQSDKVEKLAHKEEHEDENQLNILEIIDNSDHSHHSEQHNEDEKEGANENIKEDKEDKEDNEGNKDNENKKEEYDENFIDKDDAKEDKKEEVKEDVQNNVEENVEKNVEENAEEKVEENVEKAVQEGNQEEIKEDMDEEVKEEVEKDIVKNEEKIDELIVKDLPKEKDEDKNAIDQEHSMNKAEEINRDIIVNEQEEETSKVEEGTEVQFEAPQDINERDTTEETPKFNEVENVDEISKSEPNPEIVDDTRNLNLLQKAVTLKEEGNEFFKNKEYAKARSKYARVFPYTKGLSSSGSGVDGMVEMAIKSKIKVSDGLCREATVLERDVNNNLAMIYIIEKDYTKAITKATLSLKIEETPKAYYRRGKAYGLKNDFENALKDLNTGLNKFKSEAKLFKDEILRTKKREKQFDKEEAERIGKAMSKN